MGKNQVLNFDPNASLKPLMCGLISDGFTLATFSRNFINVTSYLSEGLPVQVAHFMPLSGYLTKFLLLLSIIKVFSSGLPRRERSFIALF